jgi:hypothetical protein
MKAKKWNYKTKKYDDYELPGKTLLFSYDMEKEITCAQCGKNMKYGEGFASREIHTSQGLGYPVCGDCYKIEILKKSNK